MRVDAAAGHRGYGVYHAERCEMLRYVVWVDDVEKRWAEHVFPYEFVNGQARKLVFEARRILILPARRLVIINPVGMGDRWVSRGDVLVSHKLETTAAR